LTLETIQWPKESSHFEHLKNFMLDLIDEDQTNFKEWTKAFSKVKREKLVLFIFFLKNENLNFRFKELDFDLPSNTQTITLFAEFFSMVDTNNNGFVTFSEVESLFNSNVRTLKIHFELHNRF
jgi:hypothetical protein